MQLLKKDGSNIVRARMFLCMCLVPLEYRCFVYAYHISNATYTGYRD